MTKKNKVIDVQGRAITILAGEEQDYISLTDMVRNIENGLALIEKWLRKKTLNRTRRVRDSFANRIGDNTWQTVITKCGE